MSSPEALDTPEVSLDDLITTWSTLLATSGAYRPGSSGEVLLVEARRLVEVEVRTRYGDESWERMLTQSEPQREAPS